MERLTEILLAGGCLALLWTAPAYAGAHLETGSAPAAYYASSQGSQPDMAVPLAAVNGPVIVANAANPQAAASPYDNVAIAKVSGAVNIRSEASTLGAVLGKIYNGNAATILDTVDGEGGKWYKIKSGSVTGYIKAEYFVTGQAAKEQAKSSGVTYGTVVGATTLRLRESPDLTSKTLTLLAEGAQYLVIGQEGDFLKVAVDSDLTGYVHKDYMTTSTKLPEAVSNEEEQAKKEDEEKRRQEAQAAIQALEQAKESAGSSAAAANQPSSGLIAANPEEASDPTVAAPTPDQITGTKAPENSGAVENATRNAVVAYAKQFTGNPYKYGGTSLTDGADCSGFVMSVYAHFGISTGRSSRDQAEHGTEISVDSVQPGDLLFYASGGTINHVGIYIGGGQIIHASNPTTGICLAPANYRTPCKAVTFFN